MEFKLVWREMTKVSFISTKVVLLGEVMKGILNLFYDKRWLCNNYSALEQSWLHKSHYYAVVYPRSKRCPAWCSVSSPSKCVVLLIIFIHCCMRCKIYHYECFCDCDKYFFIVMNAMVMSSKAGHVIFKVKFSQMWWVSCYFFSYFVWLVYTHHWQATAYKPFEI